MTDKQYITLDDLPQIAAALKSIERRDLPGAGSRPLSNRQAVLGLAETLLEKKRAGFTTEDLLEALKVHNLNLKACALNRYLKEYQEAHQPQTDDAVKKQRRSIKRDGDGVAPNTAPDPVDSQETTSPSPTGEPSSADNHSRNEAA